MDAISSPDAGLRGKRFPPTRVGVSLLFLINGFITGSWAPKIPEFAARLGLSEAGLGLMILGFGLGSLLTMPVAGGFIARSGSRMPSLVLAVGCSVALLLVTFALELLSAALAVIFFGGAIGGMDVAMNANAVEVERRMGKAIMSSCHGFWSLGGLIGAAAGGYAISLVGIAGHALLVSALGLAALAAAWSLVLDDRQSHAPEERHPIRFPRSALPYLIGIMALFSMIPEGAVLDWGALYLRSELGADVAVSGLAFGALSAAMAAMRFAGDALRNRLGAVATLRLCGGFALAGLALAGLAPNALVAIAGFALAGIGLSNMVPIVFSAAGNLPGLAPGIALSVATTMGYSGILVAPSAIGFVASHTGFAAIFLALPVLLLAVVVLSGLARYGEQG